MHILFLFLDGVGLGADDPTTNPLATATIPNWMALLNGQRPLARTPRTESAQALFIPTDAGLGVAGPPQSASGQATIITGENVPQAIGKHWGPKPDAAIAERLKTDSIFHRLKAAGLTAALLNAYPPRYFQAIESGRRNYSAIPLAYTSAGFPLFTLDDLRVGRAFSADFTGAGWRGELGFSDTPIYTPREAGQRVAEQARQWPFAFFEYWLTDFVGHRGSLEEARTLLETFDAVLGGLLEAWDFDNDLIMLTSDHGNLEDLSHKHHTINRVPSLLIGAQRHAAEGLTDLTGFVPVIQRLLIEHG